jgi:hypothetical protein
MGRTLFCSLVGAGVGFLVGYAIVRVTSGAQPASDATAIVIILGSFLAGTGAIAGAIIGGVADLREFFGKKGQAPREAQDRDSSEAGR